MNANSEELYLEAEADIKNNNYAVAFKKYESILYEEPDSAPAHNARRNSLFDHRSDPVQRVRFLLSEAWGSCVDVAASATDGWSRQLQYDQGAVRAFVLAPV